MRAGLDDVGFLLAVLDHIGSEVEIDARRVYATGISNGGMMAYRLGCEAGDRVAAIAPVAATVTVDCTPSAPVSLLHIHGLADQNVPFEGGEPTKSAQADPPSYEPVREGVETFVEADRCSGGGDRTRQDEVEVTTWAVCAAGTAVELVTIDGGGHSWPGGRRLSGTLDPPSAALDATPRIWDFFDAHPKGR
jgi:polyhydroxybutyrate depolymerase